MRRATQQRLPDSTRRQISIHALLAESDLIGLTCGGGKIISIHALLAESDSAPSVTPTASRNFYPRSPCGERRAPSVTPTASRNFYPRSPCGERRVHYDNYNLHCVISIHALLAESDVGILQQRSHKVLFLSTLSLRRATRRHSGNDGSPIHFYPRSPCGERRYAGQIYP